ncbi:putative PHD type zinc finger protein with BAH domain-containing protein [Mucor circinelloides]
MEFFTSHKKDGQHVRIAFYERFKDISSRRKSVDPWLLVATMYSDVLPVSFLQSKCTVIYKQDIKDAACYKIKEDHFYYDQLYNRDFGLLYDLVRCSSLKNLPLSLVEALKSSYEFVAVKQENTADFTVERKACSVCSQETCQCTAPVECSAATATEPEPKRPVRVTRSRVKQKQQQQVSLNAMKSGGSSSNSYNLKLSIDSEDQQANTLTMTNMWPFRYFDASITVSDILDINDSIFPRASTQIGDDYQVDVPAFKGPYYYPHHSSFTTASTPDSVSAKEKNSAKVPQDVSNIQAQTKDRGNQELTTAEFVSMLCENSNLNIDIHALGSIHDTETAESDALEDLKAIYDAKASTKSTRNQDIIAAEVLSSFSFSSDDDDNSLQPTRGTDSTVTAIYRPGILDETVVDQYMDSVKQLKHIPLPPHNSDLIDRALYELDKSGYDTEAAYNSMSKLNKEDFEHITEWTQTEVDAFEQSIRTHGHDFNHAKAAVKTKNMADIVRYFYQWKKTERYEPVYSEWTNVHKPRKKFKDYPQNIERDKTAEKSHQDAEDITIVAESLYSSKPYQCMNCSTTLSEVWRRSLYSLGKKGKVLSKVLCNDCGVYWLKNAKARPLSPKTRSAKVSTSSGYKTAASASVSSSSSIGSKRKEADSPVQIPKKRLKSSQKHAKPTTSPCNICHSMTGPANSLYMCTSCGMSVHSGCYGVKEKTEQASWQCDPCQNRVNPVGSQNYECVLCYNAASNHQALKMTSGYNWVHVQCAVFIPEIKFVNPSTLSPVEYIGCVNTARVEAICSFCSDKRGACVACPVCNKSMHVQCAVNNNSRLAFEMVPYKQHQQDDPVMSAGLFDSHSASGIMVPQVICSSHCSVGRNLVEMNQLTASGSQESALSVFCRNYKSIPSDTTPAMRRYLAFSPPASQSNEENTREIPPPPNASSSGTSGQSRKSQTSNSCSRCHAKFSPIWWNANSSPYCIKKVCQRCHHKEK